MMDENDLLKLKKDIDEAKQKYSEHKGKKEYLLKELKEKWGCSTVEQAKKKLEKMDAEIDDLASKIEEGLKEIENEQSS